MGKSKRKRLSTTKLDRLSKPARSDTSEDEENRTSESESENAKNRDEKKNGSVTDGDYVDESHNSDSNDEALVRITTRSKRRSPSLRDKDQNRDRELEVEAIISQKQLKGTTRYQIKWKDSAKGETWATYRKATAVCPNILRTYIEETQKALEVDAILSQRRKNGKSKFLIKWKKQSKGETWETEFTTSKVCPKLLSQFIEETELAEQKANEVEAIVGHEVLHRGRDRYLIKWKDHSKGETWETTRKTISLCPDILEEFIKERPECAHPPIETEFIYLGKDIDRRTKEMKKKVRRKKVTDDEEGDAEEEDDENMEWEVERIVNVRNKKDKTREFLIRWKGYRAEDDSWEAEEHLNCLDLIEKFMAQMKGGKRLSQKDLRPVPNQTDRLSNRITKKSKSSGNRSSKRSDRK